MRTLHEHKKNIQETLGRHNHILHIYVTALESEETFLKNAAKVTPVKIRERNRLAAFEARETITALSYEGLNDEEIGKAVKLPASLVTKERHEMGLLSPEEQKKIRAFTKREDAKILELRNLRAYNWTTISKEIGNITPEEVQARHDYLERMILKKKDDALVRKKCLSCGKMFLSENPKTNRRCTPCKEGDDIEEYNLIF